MADLPAAGLHEILGETKSAGDPSAHVENELASNVKP